MAAKGGLNRGKLSGKVANSFRPFPVPTKFDLHIALHGLQHLAQVRRRWNSHNCLANNALVQKRAIRYLVCKLVCFARLSTLCMHANQI
jgi:hypothetical protein